MKKMLNVLFFSLFFCALFARENVDCEFDVKQGQELDFNSEAFGGTLVIRGWDESKVKVSGEITNRSRRRACDLDIIQDDRGVAVSHDCDDDDWVKGDLIINVPRKFDLFVKTVAKLEITDVEGRLQVSVANNNGVLSNCKGRARVSSANGWLTIEDSNLDGSINNVNGRLKIDNSNAVGEISITNSSLELMSADSGIEVRSVNGSININSVKRFMHANTVNGSVEIGELDGSLDVETLNGSVIVNFTGDVSQGDHDIDVKTMNGHVELFLPDDFTMDVDIEVRKDYEGRNRHKYKERYAIESDFAIDIEEPDSRRVQALGSGKVGDGQHKVRIRAVNGDVFLKKKN